ncbi:uncharacterized protein Tco025E_05823 [Trypanosoma conorhini]|uniref:Uncharacterized protein n=1 Tax=Trypanosoma conorhini TaxID=83891 RepID=A0A422P9T6_9TRYP|nr:uncharacterized protein Tco025E_05823 [Trypanosoma conorhini]RNF14491.1 hypothetical protein Tco025E_05823 [Trypanosoma conorhini]
MDARVKELLSKSCAAAAPWEAAVQVASSLLRSSSGSPHEFSLIYAAVGECMRVCIRHRKAADALCVYELLSRSGHLVGAERHPRPRSSSGVAGVESLQSLSVDELALVALQQQPHRAHQSRILAQMIAAEGEDVDYARSVAAAVRGRAAAPNALPFDGGAWASVKVNGGFKGALHFPLPGLTELTEAEQFRILLQQGMQLLRETRYSQQRLGLYYLFSQMRRVVDDKRLSSQVEVAPLLRIGRAVLDHPFVFAKPSTEDARRQLLFEDFGSLALLKGLSEVQRAKLMALEATVEPLRPLCKEPLRFMQSLAASWDTLLVRRVALTLVLPSEAHDVLPRSRAQARVSGRSSGVAHCTRGGGSSSGSCSGGGRWREERRLEDGLTAAAWTEASGELFGGAGVHDAAARVELLLNRRLHHNIVVPDTAFLLQNTNQLLQLSRHREVVVPHSVFLDLVHSALDDEGPRRFHSRRVLLSLMHATTTAASKKTLGDLHAALDPYAVHTRRSQGGVTLLGLQDEVFLLEDSHERFFLAEDALAGEELAGEPNIGSSSLISVLVAKQLAKLVSSTSGYVTCRGALDSASEVDTLVAGVLASMKEEAEAKSGHAARTSIRGKPAPLFKSRSRSFWARTPVVLATTSDVTRRVAFMVGLSMFPAVDIV